MSFNSDELVRPPWMNESFFTIALGKFEHDPKVKINSLDFKPATKIGDHFASIMFRVTAEYDVPKYKKFNEKRVMIVKTVPFVPGTKADMLQNSPVFKTESKMYTQVLPEMERLLHAAGDDIQLCPRLIYQSFDPAPVIILEDICVDGFEMTGKPFDYETGLKIASMLAKFHATSMYIKKNDMDLSTKFTEAFLTANIPNTNVSFLEVAVLPQLDLLLDELKSWPDNDLVVEKFVSTKEKCVRLLKDVYANKNENIYSVLNHNDFHFKNIMVKLEGGKTSALKLLDFQCCLWGTPAIDIIYLIYMMLNVEARERRQDVIMHYYNEFSATLKKIGYLGKVPTLMDLNLEVLQNGSLEFLFVFYMILFQYMDFSEIADSDDLFDIKKDRTAAQRALFKLPQFHEILKKEIPRLIGLGILA